MRPPPRPTLFPYTTLFRSKMGKVMRHTLGASLNIRHNLSSSKGKECRSEERFSRNAETDLVCRLLPEKKKPASCGPGRVAAQPPCEGGRAPRCSAPEQSHVRG